MAAAASNQGAPTQQQSDANSAATANDFDSTDDHDARANYDYDLVVLGGGSGGIAAANVRASLQLYCTVPAVTEPHNSMRTHYLCHMIVSTCPLS